MTQPRYIFGPFNDQETVGVYRGVVSLYLPPGTTLVGTGGDPLTPAPVLQTEGGRPVVGFDVDVPAGTSRNVVLELQMAPRAPGPYSLTVVPSPRVRPTRATVHLAGDARLEGSVTLDRTWRFTSGRPPSAVDPFGPSTSVGGDPP